MSKTDNEIEPSDYLYERESSIFGKDYVKWTEDWWNWLAGIPKKTHPARDSSGRYGLEHQPEKNIWFLAGEVEGKAKRTITIPAGRAILFPIVNYEWSLFEMPGFAKQDFRNIIEGNVSKEELEELREFTEEYLDYMYSLDMIIDEGEDSELKLYTGKLCKYRLDSVFDITFSENNIFNTHSGKTKAATDGYWVFIKENVFKEGEKHTIWFRGITQYYSTEVTYSITIGPIS
jgi:hypothetical protein